MSQETVIIGREENNVVDIISLLDKVQEECYDFIVVPLFHPKFNRDVDDTTTSHFTTNSHPYTRSDLTLSSNDWGKFVVGKISTWIQLDSPDTGIRTKSEKILQQELSLASHLALPACLIPAPDSNCQNYARMMSSLIKNYPFLYFWIRIPLLSTSSIVKRHLNEKDDIQEDESWKIWNKFRNLVDHSDKIGVALEITADLPDQEEINRWLSEPIKTAILPTHIFQTNAKGAPLLSRSHLDLLMKLLDYNVQIIISGPLLHPSFGSKSIYQRYITHIYSKMPPLTKFEKLCMPYYDYLQRPLQPLMDNLEANVYETFEKDPIKYKQYEDAIFLALNDFKEKRDKEIVVMVVGAGRGPIVESAMKAAIKANAKVKLYALDKNPNALLTLRTKKMKDEHWKDIVIVHEDMRNWTPPELCDILVSELLGSFGDNELSPECLQGAEKLLKEDSVSIPYKYTSYISPVSTTKLFTQAKSSRVLRDIETPYVVFFRNHFLISEIQPCFTFEHPSPKPIDNRRYKCFSFEAKKSAIIHGFAGYFDCYLYKDIFFSIRPDTHTKDMTSWFPIYFPIANPITVKENEKITVEFWRKEDKTKVWYEWSISEPSTSVIHNINGRSSNIGL